MAPALNDVIRVTAKMSVNDSDVQNVYHIRLTTIPGSPTNAVLLGEIADVIDGVYDTVDGVMSSELSFDSIECYNMTQDEYVGEAAFPLLTVGSNANLTAPQLAGLVLFNTGTLRSQGRKFLGMLGNAVVDTDGTPTSAFLTTLTNFAAEVLVPLGWSTFSGEFGNYRDITGAFIDYTGSVIRDIFASQRRRYFGSGS